MADKYPESEPAPPVPATPLTPNPAQFRRMVSVKTAEAAARNHLGWGRAAMDYTASQVKHGAANKPRDMAGSLWYTTICVNQLRYFDSDLQPNPPQPNPFKLPVPEPPANLMWIARQANAAKKHGCGNCGEQAPVAFMYLYTNGLRPLDYMQIANGDHNFVVLGRESGDAADPQTWGPRSVVIDPHADRLCGGMTMAKLQGIKYFQSWWREV